ncbi:hypothetical protein HID58_059308, partial [Brassica napus]
PLLERDKNSNLLRLPNSEGIEEETKLLSARLRIQSSRKVVRVKIPNKIETTRELVIGKVLIGKLAQPFEERYSTSNLLRLLNPEGSEEDPPSPLHRDSSSPSSSSSSFAVVVLLAVSPPPRIFFILVANLSPLAKKPKLFSFEHSVSSSLSTTPSTIKGSVTGFAAGTIYGTILATWKDVPRVERNVFLPGLIRTLKMMGTHGLTFAAIGGVYIGVEQVVQSYRGKRDFFNGAIGDKNSNLLRLPNSEGIEEETKLLSARLRIQSSRKVVRVKIPNKIETTRELVIGKVLIGKLAQPFEERYSTSNLLRLLNPEGSEEDPPSPLHRDSSSPSSSSSSFAVVVLLAVSPPPRIFFILVANLSPLAKKPKLFSFEHSVSSSLSTTPSTIKGSVTGFAAGTIYGTILATWKDVPRVERNVFLPGLIRTLKMMGTHGLTFAAIGGVYIGVEQVVQSYRGKRDFFNGAIGGFVAGASVLGYRARSIPTAIAAGATLAATARIQSSRKVIPNKIETTRELVIGKVLIGKLAQPFEERYSTSNLLRLLNPEGSEEDPPSPLHRDSSSPSSSSSSFAVVVLLAVSPPPRIFFILVANLSPLAKKPKLFSFEHSVSSSLSTTPSTIKGSVTGFAAGTIYGTILATWKDVPRVERNVFLPGLIRTLKMMGTHGLTFAAIGGVYIGVEQVVQSYRGKRDFFNGAIGGFVAGASVLGYRARSIPTAIAAVNKSSALVIISPSSHLF